MASEAGLVFYNFTKDGVPEELNLGPKSEPVYTFHPGWINKPEMNKWNRVALVILLVGLAAISLGIACSCTTHLPKAFLQEKVWISLVSCGAFLTFSSLLALCNFKRNYSKKIDGYKRQYIEKNAHYQAFLQRNNYQAGQPFQILDPMGDVC